MEKRLIPYSVHLPEPIYAKLKKAAGERKASALVRDAITMMIDGSDAYTSGYNKALADAAGIVATNKAVSGIVINGNQIGNDLQTKIMALTIKEKKHGKTKKV
jgi:hypothetical protein